MPDRAQSEVFLQARAIAYDTGASDEALAALVEATQEADHERFLQTYEPVITRLPAAVGTHPEQPPPVEDQDEAAAPVSDESAQPAPDVAAPGAEPVAAAGAMAGRRRPDVTTGFLPDDLQAGDYWKLCAEDGSPLVVNEEGNLTSTVWGVCVPMSYGFAVGQLTKHTVREEDDGTISVRAGDGSSNSILITGHDGEKWHGYIEHGVFQAT